MQNFRTYQLALNFYKSCQGLKLRGAARSQFERAVLSIPLNIAEGSAKPSPKEREKFRDLTQSFWISRLDSGSGSTGSSPLSSLHRLQKQFTETGTVTVTDYDALLLPKGGPDLVSTPRIHKVDIR